MLRNNQNSRVQNSIKTGTYVLAKLQRKRVLGETSNRRVPAYIQVEEPG